MDGSEFDLVVVGAGIVGLATARAAQRRWPDARILVLEAHGRVAAGQSGHNSGVLHSGIYYAPGSRKALLCRRGRALMERFCEHAGVPLVRRGKVIVATRDEELPGLDRLEERGHANGLEGLRRLDAAELREVEPWAAGVAALHVPEAAAVDFGSVCDALARQLADAGAVVVTGESFLRTESYDDRLGVVTSRRRLRTRALLGCAGLFADLVARRCGARLDLRVIPFRGEYWRLADEAAAWVRGLIYPVPDPELPFLGVHLTRDVEDVVEAGPNAVLAFAREGYRRRDVDLAHLARTVAFPGFWRMVGRHGRAGLAEVLRSADRRRLTRDLQRLVPAIRSEHLSPAPAGVRAQVVRRDGSLVDDFEFARGHRSVHVINAPSPAATASLAIADELVEEVASLLED